jgi:hypothetical protein
MRRGGGSVERKICGLQRAVLLAFWGAMFVTTSGAHAAGSPATEAPPAELPAEESPPTAPAPCPHPGPWETGSNDTAPASNAIRAAAIGSPSSIRS